MKSAKISPFTRTVSIVILLLALTSCQGMHARPPVAVLNNNWLDLVAGWRLRVIAPVLRDPTEPYALTVTPKGPFNLEVTAAPNLKGFETQYYSLRGKQNLLRIHPIEATVTVNGITEHETKNFKNYFPLPSSALHMRLVFLARSNEAPHDMALIYAKHGDALENLSAQVIRNPRACDSAPNACMWVPSSIAVRAEHLSRNDRSSWEPVQ